MKWKTLDKICRFYEISTDGEIRHKKTKRKRKATPKPTRAAVSLFNHETKKTTHVDVATIMLKTFVCEPPLKHSALFKDGNAENLKLSNLYWGIGKKKPWYPKESEKLTKAVSTCSSWKEIAAKMDRTINECRSHWKTKCKEEIVFGEELMHPAYHQTEFEQWRPVAGTRAIFQISDRGRLYSTRTGQFLAHNFHQGYRRATINRKRRLLHALVMEAFGEPPPTPHHQIRHLDGKRDNNRISNLKWGTAMENAQDKVHHGTLPTGEKNGKSTLTAAQVEEARAMSRAGTPTAEISQKIGIKRRHLYKILKNECWVGFFL